MKEITARTRITRKMLRDWGACWSDERIARRVPARGFTLKQMLLAPGISYNDRDWIMHRALGGLRSERVGRYNEVLKSIEGGCLRPPYEFVLSNKRLRLKLIERLPEILAP